jgi:nitrite reductase (NADH) large subunit
MSDKIVIVGNGPAAVSSAETIRSLDSAREIVLISKESVPFYSPCPLAGYVGGTVPRERLFLRDADFYSRMRVKTLFGCAVTGIDTAERRVRYSGWTAGEIAGYGRLLIAAGAVAITPAILGLRDTTGVFTLKTLSDADGILSRIAGARRAVVIGSGFIGLEAAQGLQRRGLHVTVVEALGQVLPQMLDTELAQMARQRLGAHGVETFINSPAEAVTGGTDGVTAVRAGGHDIPCDIVICAAGVRANLAFLAGSGIATERGILADDRMRTSQPDVYAAGDVIELNGRYIPNWPNAVNTGRIAALNMMGQDRRYSGLDGINVGQIFETPVASCGAAIGEQTLRWASGGVVRKIFVTNGRVVGGQLWGDVNATGVYHELMKKGMDVSAFAADLPRPDFRYGRLVRPVRVTAA